MGDEIRERIVRAAREMFGRYGYRKTSLAEIADAARMGKSSLYHYFESKEDLFEAVLKAEINVADRRLNAAIGAETTPAAKLKAYVRTWLDLLKELSSTFEVLHNEGIDHLACYHVGKERAREAELLRLTAIIGEGVEQRVFHVDNVAATARAVQLGLHSLDDPWVIGDMDGFKEDIDRLIDLLLRGLQG